MKSNAYLYFINKQQTMEKLIEIENIGIVKQSSNGARSQTIIFKIGNHRFRISIHSESYESQSYAVLDKWTDQSGFGRIVAKNPKRDYGIDLSYSDGYAQTAFKPIIDDLKKLAKSFI